MTSVSTMGQALNQIRLISDQNLLLSQLTNQLATGKKTQKFSGLGTDVLTSERSRSGLNTLDVYTNNIKIADRQIKTMINAIEEFKAHAENFSNALILFSQESVHQQGDEIIYDDPLTPGINENLKIGMNSAEPDVDFSSLQQFAGDIFEFMVDLLNTKDGDRYLLGGADTLNKPIVDNGTLDAAVSTLLAHWKDETLAPAVNLTNSELISALESRDNSVDANAVTDTIIGYNATLSSGNVGKVFVRADEVSEVEYTVLANNQPFRDIMVALSYFKNDTLAPIADVYAEPYTAGDPTLADGAPGATLEEMKNNFFEVFNAMSGMLNQAIEDMNTTVQKLESARARLDSLRKKHAENKIALESTVADIENVDINEVAINVQMLQIRLDASYRLSALTGELSLVNFIN